jgi:hypothetical protein
MLPQSMTATLANNTGVMALAKYTVEKLRLSAGYEWIFVIILFRLHRHGGRRFGSVRRCLSQVGMTVTCSYKVVPLYRAPADVIDWLLNTMTSSVPD